MESLETVSADVAAVTGVSANAGVDLAATSDGSVAVTAVTAISEAVNAAPPAVRVEPLAPEVPKIDRPGFAVHEDYFVIDGERKRPGTWWHGYGKATKDMPPPPIDVWVCGPLHVDAIICDVGGHNFGRLLRFRDSLGCWKTWAMPMTLLAGDGVSLREELLAAGLELGPDGRRLLAQYLQAKVPQKKLTAATTTGWHRGAFVLPHETLGPDANDIVFQASSMTLPGYGVAGTLDEWRHKVAELAVGNPLLAVAISAAFAGPLLSLCNRDGGGLHLVGESSTGKSTALRVSASVWGGEPFRRSWRATANGMEGAAALHNDSLLPLDEIGECDPREVGEAVYALGNGQGKQRAGRTGDARAVRRFRVFVISTGEFTIADYVAKSGKRAPAGALVRILDVPVRRQFGLFDDLHGRESGRALADELQRSASQHFGHAGREYLNQLTHDDQDFAVLLEQIRDLPEFRVEDGDQQTGRAADRFALIAMAGELATSYGMTGWAAGTATEAAGLAFALWRYRRGRGSHERQTIMSQLRDFIEKHGEARFSSFTDTAMIAPRIRDRAGWWRDTPDARVYLFTAGGLREAVGGGDNIKPALEALSAAGVLPATGERSSNEGRAPDGRQVRLYRIDPRLLETSE